ncbi:histone acetyltransferase NGG1 [Aspergillus aculeatinus CBS 121060]|uniref:Uncharacterized protein n=1 Tax=Aspergillus aculeatinus CBS 121060 TaxID=1448322 RepID=A0ACD1HB93_9EURO|nr:hypothetical protein BO66DRAFT_437930 [Aspergillus aculeatinus CBS 121060]RAH70645.1 hypothetical protein BO66DRAFT_437930 [Aspergillus aculeatinus CBS 121060]
MPAANKGKGKGRDRDRDRDRDRERDREVRPSRSRNTTPSSSFSAGPTAGGPVYSYLDNDASKLMMNASIQYGELLERMGGVGPIPDSKSLEMLMEHLKALSQLAETRGDVCNAGIRELSQKRKEVADEPELGDREGGGSDRLKMKREADEEDEEKVFKGGKLKKRKERGSSSKEDRPLAHGAHGLARQDGAETKVEGAASPASKKSKNAASDDASLSPKSPREAAEAAKGSQGEGSDEDSDDSSSSHQPEPAPAVPQVQVFGPNPLKFDDPTIYHIREVTPDMTDEEKKFIYSVNRFPRSDLSHMMAGVPPDRDFSNSKPTNQVSANTFLAYVDPYVRPMTEEDMAFLKEKGDRASPFIMPRRGKKHYAETWAEEDGLGNSEQANGDKERLPLNQGRGNIDQVTDETVETDKVSVGPLVSRLYSLLRYEHRSSPDDTTTTTNGDGTTTTNGLNGVGDSMDLDHPSLPPPLPNGSGSSAPADADANNKPLASATAFPDASPNGFKTPAAKLDHAQLDERLKAELRHVGFLGAEDNPDYDAHYDDDIAQRLRLLQSELKKQMIINSARKTRLLDIARERMAHQEYMTIHDDLDSQVQQAYLKRTRTLGKSKKGSQAKHRPGGGGAGGAGAGGHVASAAGVGRPAIGDVARTLMDRRKRWRDCIGPVFRESKTSVPGREETVFEPAMMAELEKAELEGWDDEQE